ncbi:MAG: UbiA family prenyltransferase [Candidatus Hydrothermarchaeales archaeon]
MFQYGRIIRPVNCAMAGIAVLIGAKIASENFLTQGVFFAIIATFFICGAGNTINDYYDHEIDKINNPERPIPSGKISLKSAYYYALILFSLGIILSIFINKLAFIVAVFNSFLLFFYAGKLKTEGFVGNLTVSYLVASPFLFGGIAVEGVFVTLILVFCAGFANVGREIVKDIEDYEGDKAYAKTLPTIMGFNSSGWIAFLFIFLAVAISPLPFVFNLLNTGYLVIIATADILFLYVMAVFLKDITIKSAKRTQKLIKIGMGIALFAFFLGSF